MRPEIKAEELEKRLSDAFHKLDIPAEDRLLLHARISGLKTYHLPTYEHSIRVALKSVDIAEYTRGWIEQRAVFYPGLLHDTGKKLIRKEILDKITGWTHHDLKEIEPHAKIGAGIVGDMYEFSAWVIMNSHKLVKDDKTQLDRNPNFSERTNLLVWDCARLLHIADFYDSATYRLNERNSPGNPRYLNPNEVRECLIRESKDKRSFIEGLYSAGIL
jgi:hypothetical protein